MRKKNSFQNLPQKSLEQIAFSFLSYQKKRSLPKIPRRKYGDYNTLKDSTNFIDEVTESFATKKTTKTESTNNISYLSKQEDSSALSKQKITLSGKIEKKTIDDDIVVEENPDIANFLIPESRVDFLNSFSGSLFNYFNSEYKNKRTLCDFIDFCFSDDFEKMIKQFGQPFVSVFMFFQLYLAISLIFLESYDDIVPYVTCINYSYLNYQIMLKCINSKENIGSFLLNKKDVKSFKYNNKIINTVIRTILVDKIEMVNSDLEETASVLQLRNKIKALAIVTEKIKSIKETEKVSYLPKKENSLLYTVVINLDDVIVSYCEENDETFAQVRIGVEKLIEDIGNYFEIVFYTKSPSEYANAIVNGINQCGVDNIIILYKDEVDGKDLSQIPISNFGRDEKKIIVVDALENYKFRNDNTILLSKFYGNEEDREIEKLKNILVEIASTSVEDVRTVLSN